MHIENQFNHTKIPNYVNMYVAKLPRISFVSSTTKHNFEIGKTRERICLFLYFNIVFCYCMINN